MRYQPARVLSCHAAAGVWVTNGLLIGNEQNIRVFNIKFIRTRKKNNKNPVLISKNRWRDRGSSYLRNSSVDAQSKPSSQVECDVIQLRSTAESTTHQSTYEPNWFFREHDIFGYLSDTSNSGTYIARATDKMPSAAQHPTGLRLFS